MAINRPLLLLLVAASATFGCTQGLIYTDVTKPLTRMMHETPRGTDRVESSRTQLKEPITREGIRAEWSSYAIGDAAQRGGLAEIDYADIRVRSVLGGLWEKTTVIVYGKKAGEGAGKSSAPASQAR